jgi:hypothetical protein
MIGSVLMSEPHIARGEGAADPDVRHSARVTAGIAE